MAVDGSGNVFATGHYVNSIDLGGVTPLTSALISQVMGPSQDAYLVKYSSTGDYLWSKSLGGDGLDDGRGVATDSASDAGPGGSSG